MVDLPIGTSIKVCEPHKVGDGFNAFVQYKVFTKTSEDADAGDAVVVTRRFKEFFGLFQILFRKYTSMGYVVPKPPERSVVAMTKLKMLDEQESDNHITERMYRLENFLNRIVKHHAVGKDEALYYFLHEQMWESKLGAIPQQTPIDHLVTKLEEVFPESVDTSDFEEWFSESLRNYGALYRALLKLKDSCEKLHSDHIRLTHDLELFSAVCTNLCFCESHGGLAKVFSRFATLKENLAALAKIRGQMDLKYLVSNVKDMLAWLRGASLVYRKAIVTSSEIMNAKEQLHRRKEALRRDELNSTPRKIGELKSKIATSEALITAYTASQETIMANFKNELDYMDMERVKQTKVAYLSYLKEILKMETKILGLWEDFLPVCQDLNITA